MWPFKQKQKNKLPELKKLRETKEYINYQRMMALIFLKEYAESIAEDEDRYYLHSSANMFSYKENSEWMKKEVKKLRKLGLDNTHIHCCKLSKLKRFDYLDGESEIKLVENYYTVIVVYKNQLEYYINHNNIFPSVKAE